jgi:tRNA(Ile)-lysidine synthase
VGGPSAHDPSAGEPNTDGLGAEKASADEPSAGAGPTQPELDVAALADVPPALRRRVLRAWLALAGVTGLTDAQLRAADVLAARGPDRAGVAVPGGLELYRAHGRLGIRPVRWSSAR